MPPPQPLLSEQATFAKHLFIQGYPLWSPDPDLLPQAHQSAGLRIGDVGTVDERGEFDAFFNILETTPGSPESPPNLPSIEDLDIRRGGGDLLPRQVVSSPETPWNVDQVEVLTVGDVTRKTTEYSATLSNDGAHIILPQGAQLFELGLHQRRLFENHAREHGADWLERFKDRLGWPRSNSLYLLTGFYKTCSWSIASFGMQTAANTHPVGVHSTLVEVDERLMREDSVWQPAGRFKCKIGPPPDRQGQNNQTIFIRGITVTPNLFKQGQSEKRKPGLLSKPFFPAWPLNSLVGDPTKGTVAETPKGDVTIQHVPQISQASHPSEIINRYLLTKEPSAKVAVTHDSQWMAMLKLFEEGQSWTLGELEKHLEALVSAHYSIVTHNETVYLRDTEHGSLTDWLLDTVHPNDTERGSLFDSLRVSDTVYLSDADTELDDIASDVLSNKKPSVHVPFGPVAIHPLLAFHPYVPPIIYNTSLPPHTLAPNMRASPHVSLSATVLEEPATQPSIHTITLVIDKFPWRLTVQPTKHYVSVRDLLEALYCFLRHPVLPSEYNTLPTQTLKDEVSTAFRNRCGSAPSKEAREQYQKGVTRVDFLRGRTRFMGLSGTKVGPDVWTLNLACSVDGTRPTNNYTPELSSTDDEVLIDYNGSPSPATSTVTRPTPTVDHLTDDDECTKKQQIAEAGNAYDGLHSPPTPNNPARMNVA